MTSGRRHYWTSGNALSWVMGVLLGGLIGTLLLIAVPRMLGGAAPEAGQAAAATTETATTETAKTEPAKTETAGTASAGAGASGGVAPGTTSAATAASTAAEGAPAVQTEAAGTAGTPAGSVEGDTEAGKAKFTTTCGGCHGMNAEGGLGGAAPSMANAKAWSLNEFSVALREGKTPEKTLAPTMQRFTPETLSDAEVANMHAFLKTVN